MMTPRAYHFMAGSPPRSTSSKTRAKGSPSQPSKVTPPLRSKSSSDRLTGPRKLSAFSPATPSQPVVIPTRPQSTKHRRINNTRDGSFEKESCSHDSQSIPPSMAALLAITSVPASRFARTRENVPRRLENTGSYNKEDSRHSVSNSSPKSWTILQSSPDEHEDDDQTEKSVDFDTDASSITSNIGVRESLSFRSLSSESIPSLDIDLDSESTRSISPPLAGSRPKLRARRDRLPSPAIPVSSDSEHPLATASFPESPPRSPPLTPVAEEHSQEPSFQTRPAKPSSVSFKSNLTASLRLLKSAAKVLNAPARLHDPSSFTIHNPTSPSAKSIWERTDASRLYNPPDFFVSANIDALPLHLSVQLPGPVPTMSVQLQPYQVSPLSTSTASAPPIFLAATNPPLDPYQRKPFQREPRENSDFLRVVVCEMNMRRAGKLSGEGRARIWLGARQEIKLDDAGDAIAGVADGGGACGAVVLDGELGEAREVDKELEHPYQCPHPPRQKPNSVRHVPRRWIPLSP